MFDDKEEPFEEMMRFILVSSLEFWVMHRHRKERQKEKKRNQMMDQNTTTSSTSVADPDLDTIMIKDDTYTDSKTGGISDKLCEAMKTCIYHDYKEDELKTLEDAARAISQVVKNVMDQFEMNEDERENFDNMTYLVDMTIKKDRDFGRNRFAHLFPYQILHKKQNDNEIDVFNHVLDKLCDMVCVHLQ